MMPAAIVRFILIVSVAADVFVGDGDRAGRDGRVGRNRRGLSATGNGGDVDGLRGHPLNVSLHVVVELAVGEGRERALRAAVETSAGTSDAGAHAERIAATAARQEQAVHRLQGQMEQVSAVSLRTLEDANTTARRASEAARSHAELERAIRELAGVAERLQAIAQHFSQEL